MGLHCFTCYQTQVNALYFNSSQTDRYSIQKADLTLVLVIYLDGLLQFTFPQTVTYPSTNHLIRTRPGVEPKTPRLHTITPPVLAFIIKWKLSLC